MKFLLAALSLLVFVENTQAQSAVDLKKSLRELMQHNHDSAGYDRARLFFFGEFYLVHFKDDSYGVKDLYCDRTKNYQDFKKHSAPGPGLIPAGNIINIEHTWPQSKFSNEYDDDMQKEDMHHLYPTDTRMNAARANLPFGEVKESTQKLKCRVAKVGLNIYGEKVFEPPANHKGNVARSLFYFAVRYNLPLEETQEAVLRKWNLEDPIDQEERLRNDAIENLQGNRNVFIDRPDLIDTISDF